MAKAMIFLKRRADLTMDAFSSWWFDEHRLLAEKLPGLSRVSFNPLPDDAPFDAVIEQWFETADYRDNCYATEIGRSVAEDSARHTQERRRFAVEEKVFSIEGERR